MLNRFHASDKRICSSSRAQNGQHLCTFLILRLTTDWCLKFGIGFGYVICFLHFLTQFWVTNCKWKPTKSTNGEGRGVLMIKEERIWTDEERISSKMPSCKQRTNRNNTSKLSNNGGKKRERKEDVLLVPYYLHACQVRHIVGDSGLRCCTCVQYFERKPLCVDRNNTQNKQQIRKRNYNLFIFYGGGRVFVCVWGGRGGGGGDS